MKKTLECLLILSHEPTLLPLVYIALHSLTIYISSHATLLTLTLFKAEKLL